MKKVIWVIFVALCLFIGLYPGIYLLVERDFGLLQFKSQQLLADQLWNIGFYSHIFLGGLALLIGWMQFSPKLRSKNIGLHRSIGKVYIICVLISGISGLFIAQSATGGISNRIAFSASALVWLSTTLLAFRAVKNGNIDKHLEFMMYSYAVCFSAVTLRIWLPILSGITGDFTTAYSWVGWLSWVPNLFVAYFIILRRKRLALS